MSDTRYLPPPLMTSEPGSFARSTIIERKPQIIRQALADNDYPPEIVQALEAFRDELASQSIRPLNEQTPDADFWNGQLAAYAGKTWLEVPWYFAETYFYRRLLEAVRYFQAGPWAGQDPFERQKCAQEQAAVAQFTETWDQVVAVEPDVAVEALLHSCLWGNRADLSHPTITEQARSGLKTREERHNLLVDHTDQARELLVGGLRRVDFVNDNVGFDLLSDLVLADFLLAQGWVQEVVFHLKDRPFFVSDAMPADVQASLTCLMTAEDAGGRSLGARLHNHLETGHLTLKTNPFWTSCLMFCDLPPTLRADLACAGLVILKGDVNYRRLLADRHWPHTAHMEEIAAYFPIPFLTLRTLKSEIMVSLQAGQAGALAAEDPDWLINGKRGVVQLVSARKRGGLFIPSSTHTWQSETEDASLSHFALHTHLPTQLLHDPSHD